MPSITIEVRREYSRDEEVAIMEAVHEAVVTAFRIPVHDRSARLIVHEPHRFQVPAGLTQPERATVVSIDAFAGRTLDAKRNLYRIMADNLELLGIPRDHIKVLIRDIPRHDWGFGGRAGSDVEISFTIEV
jgi:phenylpyruvate tautomerase PptA (4-oxalocrotonate tautomerase family)